VLRRLLVALSENMPRNDTYASKGVDQCIKTTNQDGCLWPPHFFAEFLSQNTIGADQLSDRPLKTAMYRR
jgi:hypothetical protein